MKRLKLLLRRAAGGRVTWWSWKVWRQRLRSLELCIVGRVLFAFTFSRRAGHQMRAKQPCTSTSKLQARKLRQPLATYNLTSTFTSARCPPNPTLPRLRNTRPLRRTPAPIHNPPEPAHHSSQQPCRASTSPTTTAMPPSTPKVSRYPRPPAQERPLWAACLMAAS
jgi:hypothetical protein